MSLDLDARQRAMLCEMGVHVWQPLAASVEPASLHAAIHTEASNVDEIKVIEPEVSHEAVSIAPVGPTRQAAPARISAVAKPSAGPSSGPELPAGVAGMDWPELHAALAHCQACAMCVDRQKPVLAAPAVSTACDWMVVGDPPDEAQERSGRPFVGDAGKLLDNMLRAVGVRRCLSDATDPGQSTERAYLTPVLKCRPALVRAPDAAELVTCAHYLRREIALVQPKVILAMGRFALRVLLSDSPPESARLPLGKLRGQVWRFAGVPVVVTYPPAYLLGSGQDKARAWQDLCLALDVVQGQGQPRPIVLQ